MEALSAAGVSVTLGNRVAVRNASLSLKAGEITAIAGPNGAGKSTLLRAMAGLVRYSGRILVSGSDIMTLPLRRRAQTIAYLPQNGALAWPMPVRDVVALGRLPHGPPGQAAGARDRGCVQQAVDRLGLSGFEDRRADRLSEGERARVLLARALAVEAPILLADEPVAALDPYHQLRIMDALRDEAARGAAIGVVLHDLSLVAGFAGHVILMAGGTIAAAGPPAEVLTDEMLFRVYRVRPGIAARPLQPLFRLD